MRTALWGMVIAGSTLAGWLSLGAGCGTLPAECRESFTCPTGSGGTPATTTTSSGVGGDSGPPPQCVPELMSGAVADSCGIFVSSTLGNDTPGAGSRDAPYKTLAAAVGAVTKTKTRIYACAEPFTESVTLNGVTGLFGGLNCADKSWAYVAGTKAKLTAAADTVPLTLSNAASSVEVADFEVKAADAMADGGSSIAVITDAVTVSFTRCDLIAGNGVKGADGAAAGESPGPSKPTDPEIAGNKGADACSNGAGDVPGGAVKENILCMLSANPIGGAGGDGTLLLARMGTRASRTTKPPSVGLASPTRVRGRAPGPRPATPASTVRRGWMVQEPSEIPPSAS